MRLVWLWAQLDLPMKYGVVSNRLRLNCQAQADCYREVVRKKPVLTAAISRERSLTSLWGEAKVASLPQLT
jgi:hypothetical protein